MPPHADGRVPAAPEHNPWTVPAVLRTSVTMLLLDTTVVNNAQRKIRIILDAEPAEIQRILDSCTLGCAVPLLDFGRLGDI